MFCLLDYYCNNSVIYTESCKYSVTVCFQSQPSFFETKTSLHNYVHIYIYIYNFSVCKEVKDTYK